MKSDKVEFLVIAIHDESGLVVSRQLPYANGELPSKEEILRRFNKVFEGVDWDQVLVVEAMVEQDGRLYPCCTQHYVL